MKTSKWNLIDNLVFTANNQLNRVLHYVVERLYQLTQNFYNLKMLHELQKWMEEVAVILNEDFEDLRVSLIKRLN